MKNLMDYFLSRNESVSVKFSMKTLIYFNHVCRERGLSRGDLIDFMLKELGQENHDEFWRRIERDPDSLEDHLTDLKKVGRKALVAVEKNAPKNNSGVEFF